jgi:iron complex outermembrane receptor protein
MKFHLIRPAILASCFLCSASALADEDEIIVTGSRAISVDEAITGVSVMTGEELLDRLAPTIGETLKTEPGVSSTFFGAGASRPIIRGQGGDRVRVLTNGIGSIDASSASPDHAVAAEPAQAERIEVLRGAALLRYGSSGSGGVVNVIDGRIPSEMPDGRVDGAVRIGASSVDSGREAAASVDFGLGGNLVLHLDGTFKETDDYKIPGFAESAALRAEEVEEAGEEIEEAFGRLENSDVQTNSITGGLSYIGDRGFLGVAVHSFNSDYGVPGGHGHEEEHDEEEHDEEEHDEEEHDEEEQEGGVTIGLEQTRIDINGALEFNGFIEEIQLFGGYADYTHTEFEAPGVPGTVFTNEGYEIRAEAIQAERNGWTAAYGAQLRSRDFAAVGEEAFVPPTNTKQLGIYMFHEFEWDDVHLEGAGRYENTDQENSTNSESRSFDLFSLSGGADVHLSDSVRLGATVFRTERAPTTEELFSNGPHLATDQFERGNPGLGKEISKGAELAFRHHADDHHFTANVFYTEYDDYIFDAETGLEEDGLSVFEFTSGDATFKGFEVQAWHDLGYVGGFDLRADALAEYVRATTENGNLPRIPPLSFLVGVDAQSDRFDLRAELDYAAAQNDVSPLERPSEDYALVNLFATWKGIEDTRLSLSVHNLFDTEARQHTSFLKELVPLPGRNIRFSISTAF